MTGPIVSVIGGGQLARMMVPSASELGITLRVLVEDDNSSAAQVVVESPVGTANDREAVEALIADADVLTFEHEHVPNDYLNELIARGVSVHPGPAALLHAQDKIVMREKLTAMSVPCPPWRALSTQPDAASEELAAFIAQFGPQVVVKTSRGGYDGKGVRIVSEPSEVSDWFAFVEQGGPALLV